MQQFIPIICSLVALLYFAPIVSAYDFEQAGLYYNILSSEDRTVCVSSAKNRETIKIPSRVFIDDTYSVIKIDSDAFKDCKSTYTISLPSTIIEIGPNAFYGCKYLHEILVDDTNMHYTSYDGVLYTKDLTTLIKWPASKTSIRFSKDVSVIEDGAFRGCSALTSVSIPNTVKTIGKFAFAEIYQLLFTKID